MLNGTLITRQRLVLGLTRHDLAKASGVSWQTLEMLERSGGVDATVLLSTLRRVAHALGLKPTDLLADNDRAGAPPADATVVGTALATHAQGLTDDVLARALGWSTERLRVLRRHSRNRYREDFTADERRHLMHLIAQGVLEDQGATVHPSFETREALTQGRRRGHEDFPRDSRFHNDTNTYVAAPPTDNSC